MKNILFFAISFCFVCVTLGQKETVFISRLSKSRSIHIYNSLAPIEDIDIDFGLYEDRKRYSLKLENPIILFAATELQEAAYVEPGDTIFVEEVNDTIHFHSTNSTREHEFNVLDKILRNIGSIKGYNYNTYQNKSYIETLISERKAKENLIEYEETIFRKIHQERMDIINKNKDSLSQSFIKYFQSYSLFGLVNKLLLRSLSSKSLILPPYTKRIIQEELNSDTLSSSDSKYKHFLTLTSKYLTQKNKTDYLYTIVSLFKGDKRNYLLYKTLESKLGGGRKDVALTTFPPFQSVVKDSILSLFNTYCTNYNYKSRIIDIQRMSEIHNAIGQIQDYNFRILDIDSIFHSKKLTYIDFWASWCIPCIREMNSENQIVNFYKNKQIRFIYISLDASIDDWREKTKHFIFMNRKNSFLLYKNYQSPFAEKYNINTIPRYMLIGKDGKIIDTDAPRPSDKALQELIDKNI